MESVEKKLRKKTPLFPLFYFNFYFNLFELLFNVYITNIRL